MNPSLLAILLLSGCGTTWTALDADGDGLSRQDGDCWDAVAGPSGSGLGGADIHPGATETWYDGVDQDCAGDDDFDADGDGFVPDAHLGAATTGVPGSGGLPGGDCWDDPAETAHPVVQGADAEGQALAWGQPAAAEVHPEATDTWYDGVDQDCAGDDDFDQDLDGFRTDAYPDATGAFGDDCADGSPLDDDDPAGIGPAGIHPGATEAWYDGTDQDCDGEDCDADADGYAADGSGEGWCAQEDCDDHAPDIRPTGTETWYDGVDQDCDGDDGDADGDGFWVADYADRVRAAGGTPLDVPVGAEGDCDDADAAIHPGATETWYDDVDQDCEADDDHDADGDGHRREASGGADCDDADPAVNPDAMEFWYDGTDQDCDGGSDYDADGDGWDSAAFGGTDCDDSDATLSPSAAETWYDGTDQDCDGASDYDADRDGADAVAWGGDDCDDADGAIHPGAAEIWYDDIDQDCAGDDDHDADADGWRAEASGGSDCDDDRADVSPDATEVWDGRDNDCDGITDDVSVADAATGWITGPSGGVLGWRAGLSLGDVTGDGTADLLVADTTEGGSEGMAWVIPLHTPSDLAGLADTYAVATVWGGVTGNQLAMLGPVQGDLTADGVADLALSGTDDVWSWSVPTAMVLEGGAGIAGTLHDGHALVDLEGSPQSAPLGILSHLDPDGDGVAELVLAAPDHGGGHAYVFDLDGATGTLQVTGDATSDFAATGSDGAGTTLGGGDLDLDGYDDLLVGGPDAEGGLGAVWVVPGTASPSPSGTLGDLATIAFSGSGSSDDLGGGAVAVADLDGDGLPDLLLGAPAVSRIYGFLGAGTLTGSVSSDAADLALEGTAGTRFGHALAAGDLDGDGLDDLAIGAPGGTDATSPPTGSGREGLAAWFQGLELATGGAFALVDARGVLTPAASSLLGYGILLQDLDLDGQDDFLIAAPAHEGTGQVWLVLAP